MWYQYKLFMRLRIFIFLFKEEGERFMWRDFLIAWYPDVRLTPLSDPLPLITQTHLLDCAFSTTTTIFTAIIITTTIIIIIIIITTTIILIVITITITIIILTRPQPPYSWQGLVGRIKEQGYSQAGTFLGVLNVSLRV